MSRDNEPPATHAPDVGTGIRRCTKPWGADAFRGTNLLRHLRLDHTQGLLFFAAADRDDARLRVRLPRHRAGDHTIEVLAGMMAFPYIRLQPDVLGVESPCSVLATGVHEIQSFKVTAGEIPLKLGRTYGYRVDVWRPSIAYLPDHWPMVIGVGPRAGASYISRPGALAEGAGEFSGTATVRQVILFHHSSDRTDTEIDRLRDRTSGGRDVQLIVAAESTVLEL